MKKIKIVHISETFVTGVYTYIRDICEYCTQFDNIESHVIFSDEREETDLSFIKEDFKDLASLHVVKMGREISLIKDLKSSYNIFKKLKLIKPDVIHLHSSKASVTGRLAAFIYKKANVYYTPNGYSFLREDITKNKRKFFWLIENYSQKIFGGITIACGDTEFEYASKMHDSFLVRNGIEINSLNHINHNQTPPNKIKKIGTIGRLSPQKNPELFDKIASLFPNIEFIWIGGGELDELLKSKNINSLGWLERKEALKVISNIDLYIQTSLWEGLPFTIIEAMTLSRPIIATNVVGNKDAVDDGINGFLCNNLEDFEKKINFLLKNPKALKNMGEASRERAISIFDRDKNFKALIKIYNGKKLS